MKPVSPMPALVAVPSLDALAGDPALAEGLPCQARRVLTLRALTVVAVLATVGTETADVNRSEASEPDRALPIEDAAKMLNMTKDYLYRNWSKLGLGYKDADGRVKFSLCKIQRHIRLRAGR